MSLHAEKNILNDDSIFRNMTIRQTILIILSEQLLKIIQVGNITVIFPNGRSISSNANNSDLNAVIHIYNIDAIRRLITAGSIGFAESYMLGHWTSPDLTKLIEIAALNGEVLSRKLSGGLLSRLVNFVEHKLRKNSKSGSKNNIQFHYDLGNSFYECWLDKQMIYSSAINQCNDESLEDAQENKISRIVHLLELENEDRVLEIGCGWGALSRKIAENNAYVHGITLSHEQLKYAQESIRSTRIAPRITFSFTDYRDIRETYDRIVSVEMIEAVGKEYLPIYFQTISRSLKLDGIAVIQAISIDERRFDRYNSTPDFIQKYIFPGGFLPTKTLIYEEAEKAGLQISYVEYFGESYAWTLNQWMKRFTETWHDIEAIGFDIRFKKMWEFYLCYCEGGFKAKSIDVGLYVIKHKNYYLNG